MTRTQLMHILLLTCSLSIWGCIGTTQADSARATRPSGALAHAGGHQQSGATGTPPCESPEVATGQLTTVETARCSGTAFEEEERTWEPPDIHPY